MNRRPDLTAEVAVYLDELVTRTKQCLGEGLVGVWLFGSAALGDFDPRYSDLDVQAVTRGRPPSTNAQLAHALSHAELPCPTRRLEFVLYSSQGLTASQTPAPLLNLNTGPAVAKVDYDVETTERFWFVIDVAIGRVHGIALAGPPASAVFPAPERNLIVTSLRESLAWHREHEPASPGAVLAACRAWAWAHDGRWRSKLDAARWAEEKLGDPTPVRRAIRLRSGQAAPPLRRADVEAILERAQAQLSAVARIPLASFSAPTVGGFARHSRGVRAGHPVNDPTPRRTEMAEITPLDEKLAEVLGLAQAAQKATDHVATMEGAEPFRDQLENMGREATETEQRTDSLIDSYEGRKTAIRDLARETKTEAVEMMTTYLEGEEEALDGFEFLTMAEAAELGHWEIVQTMGDTLDDQEVVELASWAVELQQSHFDGVRASSLELAKDEARG